jgi:hypothetical protein
MTIYSHTEFFLKILIRLNPGLGNGFGALYYTDLPLFIYWILYLLLNYVCNPPNSNYTSTHNSDLKLRTLNSESDCNSDRASVGPGRAVRIVPANGNCWFKGVSRKQSLLRPEPRLDVTSILLVI